MTAEVSSRGGIAWIGWGVGVVGLALDQITKAWVLKTPILTEGGGIALGPVAELRLVWNRGISYGLFQQGSDFGRWLLVAISVAAAIGLAIWLTRVTHVVVAVSLGLILAGAIGNAIDRTVYGAVIDFIYTFSPDRSFRWYVFNIADAAIVAGVIGLMYDSVLGKQRR